MDDTELRALLAAQAQLIRELSERIAPTRPVQLLGDLFAKYEKAQRTRSGWRTAASMVTPFVTMFATRDCASLQVADWTAYRVSREDLAPSSLNYTMRVAKAMLRWGKTEGHLIAVPQLCEAKRQKQKGKRETAPTEQDNLAMLEECTEAHHRVIVLCSVDAGLRNGEIRHLERSWVDRDRMEIHLWANMTKSKKSRSVPLTKRLLAAIDAIPRDIRSPLVLVSPKTGGPYALCTITTVFQSIAELAGVKAAPGEGKVRCHDGRHGFATNALDRGVKISAIQKMLGHATLQQTADYVSERDTDIEQARVAIEVGIAKGR